MASNIYTRMTHSLQLTPRLFGSKSSSDSNKTVCELPDSTVLQNPQTAALAGGFDFFTLTEIITGACAAFTLLSMLVLMFRHATHLSRPNEQLNILRIASYLPILAVGSFLQIAAPSAFVYLSPWLDFAQAIALCNFFLLMCQFVSPSDSRREMFFAGLQAPQSRVHRRRRRGNGDWQQQPSQDNSASGLHWYRRMWLLIFQYPVVQLLVAIFTDITEAKAVYCLTSSTIHFAHLWLNLIHSISLVLAVMSCLRLCNALRQQLAHHKPLSKLLAFKGLVGLEFLVEIVYWILRSVNPSPFHPTAQLSWFDLYAGIPTMIIAIATVPFSLFFYYAYPVTPYYLANVNANVPIAHRRPEDPEAHPLSTLAPGSDRNSDEGHDHPGKFQRPSSGDDSSPAIISTAGSSYQGGFLGFRAWVGMLNPSELLSGFVFGFTMLNKRNRQMGVETVRRAQTGEFGRM